MKPGPAKPQKSSLRWLTLDPEFQISEYEVHQVGLKDSGSQNFSPLALKEKAVDVIQILCTTATARDRRIFFFAQNMFFSYKKS
jgi:hypothetical protein